MLPLEPDAVYMVLGVAVTSVIGIDNDCGVRFLGDTGTELALGAAVGLGPMSDQLTLRELVGFLRMPFNRGTC